MSHGAALPKNTGDKIAGATRKDRRGLPSDFLGFLDF
jgi:hypothetical protein